MAEFLTISQASAKLAWAVDSVGELTLMGEVSGYRGPNAKSGHYYFQLKDTEAAIDVIIWRSQYKRDIELRDGLTIRAQGHFQLYVRTGRMSFIISAYMPDGEGILRQQIEALRKKLLQEGLFSKDRKKQIPEFCERICVVTSTSGSVLEDVRQTITRRNTLVRIEHEACSVQGLDAPQSILAALTQADRRGVDAILLVRGGGSLEDLMCFNDEGVARTIASLTTPVITGIGHAPDRTIADLVADRAATTPTAAAESVAPTLSELKRRLEAAFVRMNYVVKTMIERANHSLLAYSAHLNTHVKEVFAACRARYAVFAQNPLLLRPQAFLEKRKIDVTFLGERLYGAAHNVTLSRAAVYHQLFIRASGMSTHVIQRYREHAKMLEAALQALSPLSVLRRGYAIVLDEKSQTIDDVSELKQDSKLNVVLASGNVHASVDSVEVTDNTHV